MWPNVSSWIRDESRSRSRSETYISMQTIMFNIANHFQHVHFLAAFSNSVDAVGAEILLVTFRGRAIKISK